MPDYVQHDWDAGDAFTADDATEMSQELEEQELKDAAQDVKDTALETKNTQQDTDISGKQKRTLRGTVATAAGTAAKVVTLEDPAYVPQPGDLFVIEFTSGIAVASATLAINGTAALPITSASGSTSSSHTALAAGVECLMLHDTTTYRLLTGNSQVWGGFTAAELQAGTSTSSRLVTPQLLAQNFLNLAAAKPASATATGRLGQYWLDATGLYICVATNTWRVFTGATF